MSEYTWERQEHAPLQKPLFFYSGSSNSSDLLLVFKGHQNTDHWKSRKILSAAKQLLCSEVLETCWPELQEWQPAAS